MAIYYLVMNEHNSMLYHRYVGINMKLTGI